MLISNSNSNSNSLLICNPTKDCHQQQYNQQTNTKHETIKKTKSSVEEIPVYQHKVQDVHISFNSGVYFCIYFHSCIGELLKTRIIISSIRLDMGRMIKKTVDYVRNKIYNVVSPVSLFTRIDVQYNYYR